MQFQHQFKEKIRRGEIRLSLRKWRKPQVKIGGRYNLAPKGAIEVTSLVTLGADEVTTSLAHKAGFEDAATLLTYLKADAADTLYRIDFKYLGDQPVNRPDTHTLSIADAQALVEKLNTMDKRSRHGPWAVAVLKLIGDQPESRSADLAAQLGMEKEVLKPNIRRLKKLGLTISLETGYRLSDRGQQIVNKHLQT
jgi:hypothetical protein